MDDLKFLKFSLLLMCLDKPKLTDIIHTVFCVFSETHTHTHTLQLLLWELLSSCGFTLSTINPGMRASSSLAQRWLLSTSLHWFIRGPFFFPSSQDLFFIKDLWRGNAENRGHGHFTYLISDKSVACSHQEPHTQTDEIGLKSLHFSRINNWRRHRAALEMYDWRLINPSHTNTPNTDPLIDTRLVLRLISFTKASSGFKTTVFQPSFTLLLLPWFYDSLFCGLLWISCSQQLWQIQFNLVLDLSLISFPGS